MYPCDEVRELLATPFSPEGRTLTTVGDQQEQDRLDIYHKLFLVARHDQLHKAPLIPNYDGPRILDLGTGTGIWAIDMAELVPASGIGRSKC